MGAVLKASFNFLNVDLAASVQDNILVAPFNRDESGAVIVL